MLRPTCWKCRAERGGVVIPPQPPCDGCGAEIPMSMTSGRRRRWCAACDPYKPRTPTGEPRTCPRCLAGFVVGSDQGAARRKFCSDACRKADKRDRRDKRKRDVFVDSVDVGVLGDRDSWKCHLCGRRVERAKRYPDPLSPSVDHLVPLAEGGAHSYANTALAHLTCNVRKGTKATGEQLRLVG